MITLVEQHHIKRGDPRFAEIDQAAFAAKNLYNKAQYVVRQSFIHEQLYIPYSRLYHMIKTEPEYFALPRKVSQQVLKQLHQNWQSFFAAMKAWKREPDKFLGRPKLPGYKDKTEGRFLLTYTDQAVSKSGLREGIIKPSGLTIEIPTTRENIKQVRIVPRTDLYVVEAVYEREPEENDLDATLIAGIDLGIDNLLTVTSNQQGFVPLAVNGRGLKSINQFYNKSRAQAQSNTGNRSTHRIKRLTYKRNAKVKHILHVASRRVIDRLVADRIGTLVIGYNPKWKQGVNIGRVNNQKFVSIPFATLIHMLTYKAALAGIEVIMQEESYTSKCSFLDGEFPQKRSHYAGRRIHRGLFRAADGTLINADVNGSYNIITKAFPDTDLFEGIEGVVVHPERLDIFQTE